MELPTNLSILIADSQLLSRMGLRQLLQASLPMSQIGEAGCEAELSSALKSQAVDIVILDFDQPAYFSVDTLVQIRQQSPHTGVLIISAVQDREAIYQVLALGVHGFLTKTCGEQEVLDAVKATARREKFYCTKILDYLLEKSFSDTASLPSPEDCSPIPLSPREVDVLRLVAKGYIAKEIADQLNLSTHTIYTHRKNILKKLNLHSSSEMLLYALHKGLLERDF